MTEDFRPFAVGRPKFTDPALQARAESEGALAAWQQAFESHGAQAPAMVEGSFAVAVQSSDGRVFLAVDRFAVHSLCWRLDATGIQCAERADTLASRAPALRAQAVFDYLYFHAIPSPRTVFEGIERLPPAHCAVFQHGKVDVRAYWVPRFQPPAQAPSFDALRAEFRSILQAAVGDLLDPAKPACFLSGGTDSSTVAGMIGLAAGRPATCYSIGFEAEGYDEMAFARIAARHFGAEHHEYYVTPDDLVRSIPDVAAHYDQPFGNSSAVPAYHCARMAREGGVSRILAGDGGDELFGGNSRYAKQRVFGWYGNVPAPLRPLLEGLAGLGLTRALPGIRKAASYVQQASVPMPDRIQTYNLLTRLGVEDVLEPQFLAGVVASDPQARQREVWAQTRGASLLDRQLAFDWRYTLAENDLPKVCGTTGLAGVEVGFPMLDQRLVDFSLRLPGRYKLKGTQLRWFFKEALRGFLPDEIITKKKQGFGLPFGVWAVKHPRLKALAQDSLGSLSTRGVVRPAFITSLLNERLPEHPGYYGEMVWILMMLEQWLRRHAPDWKLRA